MDPSLGFVALAALSVLAGMMTALEVAVASLGRLRLTALLKTHPRHHRMIHALMAQPQRVMGAVALLTDLVLALTGIAAAMLSVALTPDWGPWATAGLAFGIAAVYLIVLGELVPYYMGRQRIAGWILTVMRPLYWIIRPLFPLVRASEGVRHALRRLLFPNAPDPSDPSPVSEAQVKDLLEHLLDEAERYGIVEEAEERMIWRILSYDELVVRQVMVPRPEVISLACDTSMHEIHETIVEEGHSRYPVYEGARDNIIGILHAKDLLQANYNDATTLDDHRELIRPPFFTPTIKPINDLLREFQSHKKHMAIVVDEFGGMAGIITLEDVLEEIVGEISDEYDEPRRMIRQLSAREYLIEGDAELSMINEQLELELPANGAVTIGGLVTEHLEEIPRPGRSTAIDGVTVVVESATSREVLKVRLRLPDPPSPAAEPTAPPAESH